MMRKANKSEFLWNTLDGWLFIPRNIPLLFLFVFLLGVSYLGWVKLFHKFVQIHQQAETKKLFQLVGVLINYICTVIHIDYSFHPLHTSTHFKDFENSSSSGIVNSIALFPLPQAGKTVTNRFRDSSKYTLTPSLTANGHTPPTA